MSRKGIPNKKGRLALVELECETCHKSFPRSKGDIKGRHFCSVECIRQNHSGQRNPNWRGGNSVYRGENWRDIREGIKNRDGHQCVRCGSAERLEVNHIVPYRRFDSEVEANRPENLETLCIPCHRSVDGLLQGSDLAPPPLNRRTIFCVDCNAEFWSPSGTARRCVRCRPAYNKAAARERAARRRQATS